MNAYRTEAEQIEDAEQAKRPRPWTKAQDDALGTVAAIAVVLGGFTLLSQFILLGVAEVTWRSFLPAPVWFPALVFLVWYARAWWSRKEFEDG